MFLYLPPLPVPWLTLPSLHPALLSVLLPLLPSSISSRPLPLPLSPLLLLPSRVLLQQLLRPLPPSNVLLLVLVPLGKVVAGRGTCRGAGMENRAFAAIAAPSWKAFRAASRWPRNASSSARPSQQRRAPCSTLDCVPLANHSRASAARPSCCNRTPRVWHRNPLSPSRASIITSACSASARLPCLKWCTARACSSCGSAGSLSGWGSC
mmetsp:Transcript_23812/g.65445  ORF Transcript_23812/g.65445 Transcript_23812/m.65445 type:complete len:209 (+) Transcript_23812:429-1055(+)